MLSACAMTRDASLYWRVQLKRNRGVRRLFVLVAAVLALYVWLFPGLLSVAGVSKTIGRWRSR